MLEEKINAANRVLDYVAAHYARPVVMSSFGKDSMVLLHLLKSQISNLKFQMPVVFHREPFFPQKYEFANRIIREWDLTVYDYAPSGTALIKRNGHLEVMNYYSFGQSTLAVPTGIESEISNLKSQILCGKNDLLLKPLGTFNYPWDATLVGHKSSDIDPVRGPVPLHVDIKQTANAPDIFFPLRTWTDADVWEYTERFNVPIHTDRYQPSSSEGRASARPGYSAESHLAAQRNGAWSEKPDHAANPDYFSACMRCIDRDEPAVVFCPKAQMEINNVSSAVRYVEGPESDPYFGPKATEQRNLKSEISNLKSPICPTHPE